MQPLPGSSCWELSWSSGNGGKNLGATSSATSCAYFHPSDALKVALRVVMVINNIFFSLCYPSPKSAWGCLKESSFFRWDSFSPASCSHKSTQGEEQDAQSLNDHYPHLRGLFFPGNCYNQITIWFITFHGEHVRGSASSVK